MRLRLFAARIGIFIHMKGQAGDGFRKDSDAGIHSRGLHSRVFVHALATRRIGRAKQPRVPVGVQRVPGRVAPFE